MNPTKFTIAALAVVLGFIASHLRYPLPPDLALYIEAGKGNYSMVFAGDTLHFYYSYHILPVLTALGWLPTPVSLWLWWLGTLGALYAVTRLYNAPVWYLLNPLTFILLITGQVGAWVALGIALLYRQKWVNIALLLLMIKPSIGLIVWLWYLSKRGLRWRDYRASVGALVMTIGLYGWWFDDVLYLVLHSQPLLNASLGSLLGAGVVLVWGLVALLPRVARFEGVLASLPVGLPYLFPSDILSITLKSRFAYWHSWLFVPMMLWSNVILGFMPILLAWAWLVLLKIRKGAYGHVTQVKPHYPYIQSKTILRNVLGSYRAWHLRIR